MRFRLSQAAMDEWQFSIWPLAALPTDKQSGSSDICVVLPYLRWGIRSPFKLFVGRKNGGHRSSDLPLLYRSLFSDILRSFLNSGESLRSRYPISRISGMLSQIFTLPYFFCPARYIFFDLERRDPSNSCRIPARRLAYLWQRFRSGRGSEFLLELSDVAFRTTDYALQGLM
jgi:hypothetical protein